MKPTLNVNTVLQRFFDAHGNKYDYSQMIYSKAIVKIIIICPLHGHFQQRPVDHWNGHGCKSCGGISANRINNEKQKNTIDENGETQFSKRYRKIHQTRKLKDNYTSAIMKSIKTQKETIIDGKSVFERRIEKWKQKRIANGSFLDPITQTEKQRYRKRVTYHTNQSLKKYGYLIGVNNRVRKSGFHVDHIYSVFDGFKNNIDHSIISHIANLRLIDEEENRKKNKRSDISIDELLYRINEFNKFGTVR